MADKQIHQLTPGLYNGSARIPQQRQVSGVWSNEYLEAGQFQGGTVWQSITGDLALQAGVGYVLNGTVLQNLLLPSNANLGDSIWILGNSASGWELTGATIKTVQGVSGDGIHNVMNVLPNASIQLVYVGSQQWILFNPQIMPTGLEFVTQGGGN
jgi:hypothetical protein